MDDWTQDQNGRVNVNEMKAADQVFAQDEKLLKRNLAVKVLFRSLLRNAGSFCARIFLSLSWML